MTSKNIANHKNCFSNFKPMTHLKLTCKSHLCIHFHKITLEYVTFASPT